jgi:hypothetical protein
MRPQSAALWREALTPYARVHLYTTDPGAHAVAVELWPLLQGTGQAGTWFADGWSAARAEAARPSDAIAGVLRPGDLLLAGSQTDFARTRQSLAAAKAAGASSGFVFDHWKNYREHFDALPDLIVVPDALGHRLLLEALGPQAATRTQILPLPSLEAAVDRVRSFGGADLGLVALLLDPTEPENGLGYDWEGTLDVAAAETRRLGLRLLVKPHPRQDPARIAAAVARMGGEVALYTGDTEELIARAQEVWGMTTIALITALQAGKTIRSFQVGRNEQGRRASNAYIEPFVLTQRT